MEQARALVTPAGDVCVRCGTELSVFDGDGTYRDSLCRKCAGKRMSMDVAASSDADAPLLGGIGARAIALCIDWTLLAIAITITMLGSVAVMSVLGLKESGAIMVTLLTIAVGVAAVYYTQIKMVVDSGATPGKKIMKLRIVTENGNPVTRRVALSRLFWSSLSTSISYLGHFVAFFDSKRRALHDRMAGTLVIKAPAH